MPQQYEREKVTFTTLFNLGLNNYCSYLIMDSFSDKNAEIIWALAIL
jgi:hypothetical protein